MQPIKSLILLEHLLFVQPKGQSEDVAKGGSMRLGADCEIKQELS